MSKIISDLISKAGVKLSGFGGWILSLGLNFIWDKFLQALKKYFDDLKFKKELDKETKDNLQKAKESQEVANDPTKTIDQVIESDLDFLNGVQHQSTKATKDGPAKP